MRNPWLDYKKIDQCVYDRQLIFRKEVDCKIFINLID